MASGLPDNRIDREIEYSFEIKLLGLPLQASAFLSDVALGARLGAQKEPNPFILQGAKLKTTTIEFA
jgi:hypothetical protein